MARIDFPDGRWVELRPMYVDEELALDDLDRANDDIVAASAAARAAADTMTAAGDDPVQREAALEAAAERLNELQRAVADRLREMRRIMADACIATSWGGPLTARITKAEFRMVLVQWRIATEDDALPPESGTSS